jgi:hypothetical protein
VISLVIHSAEKSYRGVNSMPAPTDKTINSDQFSDGESFILAIHDVSDAKQVCDLVFWGVVFGEVFGGSDPPDSSSFSF